MKRFTVFIFTVVFAMSAYAQTGKVSFSLIDSQTKQGVMGAVVEVYPTAKPDNKKYYTSGAEGYVSISGTRIPPSSSAFRASRLRWVKSL